VPEPTAAARRVVARAEQVVVAALDALGPGLIRASGHVRHEPKADGTPVTDADRDTDDRLRDAIADAFPDHGLVSEERDTVIPDTEWCWVVDPIDGTSNFLTGLPYWCVSVALTLDGEPVLGVVDAPALGARYVASAGGGARRGTRSLRVAAPVDWRDPRNGHVPVMLTTATARRARAAGLRLNPRVMGSTALDLAVVAEGVAAASVALVPRVWDVAAGAVLVHEAGGAMVTVDGAPLLPLVPGDDHAERTAIVCSGPDEPYVRDLTAGLLEDT
jgi:myo-inositol-1(or 4)-monophosphatase